MSVWLASQPIKISPVAEGPGLWRAGGHGTGKIEGDGNAATLDHRVQGVLLGYGSGASTEAGSWTLGGAIGTTDARADVDGRNSRANGCLLYTSRCV